MERLLHRPTEYRLILPASYDFCFISNSFSTFILVVDGKLLDLRQVTGPINSNDTRE